MDAFLWTVSALWLIDFIRDDLRVRRQRKIRKLDAPSIHCERTPDWRVNAMTRHQAE
jgi:hypothetical protein